MADGRGKFTLEVPIGTSELQGLAPKEQQDLKVVAQAQDGSVSSSKVNLRKDGTGSAKLTFSDHPGAVKVFVGPDRATDEELLQSQTITVDVRARHWADAKELSLTPIAISRYYWFWWLRWCRELAWSRASPHDTVVHPALGQHHTHFVEHADVVMGFGPVDPYEDHPSPPLGRPMSPEGTRGTLMDQCSRHVIPPAVSFPSPTDGGTI